MLQRNAHTHLSDRLLNFLRLPIHGIIPITDLGLHLLCSATKSIVCRWCRWWLLVTSPQLRWAVGSPHRFSFWYSYRTVTPVRRTRPWHTKHSISTTTTATGAIFPAGIAIRALYSTHGTWIGFFRHLNWAIDVDCLSLAVFHHTRLPLVYMAHVSFYWWLKRLQVTTASAL